jgi:hypothetical protein
MSKSDQLVNVTLVLLILLYISTWAIGYFTGKLAYLISSLNLLSSISMILYWAVREMHIKEHTIELREIIVLSFEVVVIGCAIYSVVTKQEDSWIRVIQYIFFGIHFSALMLALIFMLTFKLNRLI